MQDNSSAKSTKILNTADLKGIIFDFDGTLIDSEPVWKEVIFDLYKRDCSVELSDEILWAGTGGGIDRNVELISEELGLGMTSAQQSAMVDGINEEVHRVIHEELSLRDGSTEIITWAHDNDVALAICTASTRELITQFLAQQNLSNDFDVIVSTATNELNKRKPFPYPYLETLKKLGVQAEESLVIEDSPNGVRSAVAAGIPTIAIPHPELKDIVSALNPTVLVTDFREILALLVS